MRCVISRVQSRLKGLSLVISPASRSLSVAGAAESALDKAFESDALRFSAQALLDIAPEDRAIVYETVIAAAQEGVYVSMEPEPSTQSSLGSLQSVLYGRSWSIDRRVEGEYNYKGIYISKDSKSGYEIWTNNLRYTQSYTLEAFEEACGAYDEVRAVLDECIAYEKQAWETYISLMDYCNSLAAAMNEPAFVPVERVTLQGVYSASESEEESGDESGGDEQKNEESGSEDWKALSKIVKAAARNYTKTADILKQTQASLDEIKDALYEAHGACLAAYGYDADGMPIPRGEKGAMDPSLMWLQLDLEKKNRATALAFKEECRQALLEINDSDFKKWLVDDERYLFKYLGFLELDETDEHFAQRFEELNTKKNRNAFYEIIFLCMSDEQQERMKQLYFDTHIDEALSQNSGRLYDKLNDILLERMSERERDDIVYSELNEMIRLSESASNRSWEAWQAISGARKQSGKNGSSASKQVLNLQKQVDKAGEIALNGYDAPVYSQSSVQALSLPGNYPADSEAIAGALPDVNTFEAAQTEPMLMCLDIKVSFDERTGSLRLTGGITDRRLQMKAEITGFDDLDAKKKEQIDEDIRKQTLNVLSVSPKRESGFAELNGRYFSFYGGEYHPLRVAAEKGVEDKYNALERYENNLWSLIGQEGIVYSHNSRYATLCNYQLSGVTNRHWIQPVLFDLSAGEIILTATHNLRRDGDTSGKMTNAVFSPDDAYMYYTVYEYDAARLYRYGIQTGGTELCATLPWWTGDHYNGFAEQTGFAWGSEGALYVLTSCYGANNQQGIARIEFTQEGCAVSEAPFLRSLFSKKLSWSETGARGLCVLKRLNSASDGRLFICFDLDSSLAGLNEYWALDAQSLRPVRVSEEEISEIMASQSKEKWADIDASILSPSGKYALLLANHTNYVGGRRLILVRLSDMRAREVDMGGNLTAEMYSEWYRGLRHMEWYDDADENCLGFIQRNAETLLLRFTDES